MPPLSSRPARWPLALILIIAAGCDAFLVDNPRNCERNISLCGAGQRCSLLRKTCVPAPAMPRPTRSAPITFSADRSLVLTVNPGDDSLSIFRASDQMLLARVKTGGEPSSVAAHPVEPVAYVTNRRDATVVRIEDLGAGARVAGPPIPTGAEPTGLCFSPNGDRLYVAEFAESQLLVLDPISQQTLGRITDVRAPRALAVTSDGDGDDADELLVVPEFFGEPQPGGESLDNGRKGVLRLYNAATLAPAGVISLAPLSAAEAGFTVGAAPNQLGAVAIDSGRAYVTSVSVSPQGPVRPDQTVAPVVYAADLASKAEVKGGAGTANLARLVRDDPRGDAPVRLFLGDLADIDFVPGKPGVAYAVARGADVVQRVVYDTTSVKVGSVPNLQIDVSGGGDLLNGCLGPTGVLVESPDRAFVSCAVSRRLAVLDLKNQRLERLVESAPLPQGGADAVVQDGRRFFYTARGRFAKDAWSSCSSCHPDGLSDGVTWSTAIGPRQTPGLDGAFSRGKGAQKQRVFGWSANFDEVHDFEIFLRGFSGGFGLITKGAAVDDCRTRKDTPANISAGNPLGTPTSKEAQDAVMSCGKDWDRIEAFLRTLRPPRGRRLSDPQSVARGAALFVAGECARCHGGLGWTVSSRFFTPSTTLNQSLAMTVTFTRPAMWPAGYTFHTTFQLAEQPASADGVSGSAAPLQVACALRNVGSFGPDGLEKRDDGTRAQGKGGYNPPSLYGLALSAPYLHGGQARTLDELFADGRFEGHRQSGSANFIPSAAERQDLQSFLLSIDAESTEVTVPPGFAEGCKLSN